MAAAIPAWAQFEARAVNPFPEGAESIAVGDFNHDGKLDVVMSNGGGFSVALGNGDGTFGKAVFYRGQLDYSIAVGDFNGDGNLDIVAANLVPSTVSVYLGNGDGTFQTTPVDSNTTEGSYFVVVGDFNNDKRLDIAVIDPPYISVLLGNGAGKFLAPSDNESLGGPIWLAVADFNNDHKLDVLATGQLGSGYTIGVLLGDGDGTLQNAISQSALYVPTAVAAGDLNGDGNVDAVLGYDLGGMAVFLGNGNGTLQAPVQYETTGLDGGYVIVSDLNLDGHLDVAVPSGLGSSPIGGVDVFWGNGDGTLQPAQLFASTVSGLPAVGDLNGDGLPDFILGNFFHGVGTILNTGVVSFLPNAAPVFSSQVINTVSALQSISLKNLGTSSLSITSLTGSGPFQTSSTCGAELAVNAKCSISVRFQPIAEGNQSGLVTIIDSASSQPQFIDLLGSATVVQLSPESLNFGSQKVGTTSPPKIVNATNVGSTAITFTGAGTADQSDYSTTTSCLDGTIQAGASCIVTVTFHPSKTGVRSGGLGFTLSHGLIGPISVTLAGTGT